jgi:hypothetical protein
MRAVRPLPPFSQAESAAAAAQQSTAAVTTRAEAETQATMAAAMARTA